MKYGILVLAAFFCNVLLSAADVKCPVVFGETNAWHQPHTHDLNPGVYLSFKLMNPNSVDIVGVKLLGAYQDSVGDEHRLNHGYIFDRIKAGRELNTAVDSDVSVERTSFEKPKLWVEKARFANGDIWEDDGSHSCWAYVRAVRRFGKH